MRILVSILLAISLSWVTTGYACRMDDLAALRSSCCCKHQHAAVAAKAPQSEASSDQNPCCDVVASSAIDQHQPGVASAYAALDLPMFIALPVDESRIARPVTGFGSVLPPARGPPGVGTRTYLATARLRL